MEDRLLSILLPLRWAEPLFHLQMYRSYRSKLLETPIHPAKVKIGKWIDPKVFSKRMMRHLRCFEPNCKIVSACHLDDGIVPMHLEDFRSGYDRGHMYVSSCILAFLAQSTCRVPAADAKMSQQAMDETFYLSNIAPQVGDGFNRHCKCHIELTQTSNTCRLGICGRFLPQIDYQL